VGWNREVGVDVEAVRALEDIDGLAASCFSPTERAALAAVPADRRLEAFYDGWTRKEAFVKLLGDGLSRPLDSFDVTLTPGQPARLVRVAGERTDRWSLQAIEVGPGYRGALASEGPAATVHLREWTVGRRGLGRHDAGEPASRATREDPTFNGQLAPRARR
jgi:4'-phosphopantetheinyl transferase